MRERHEHSSVGILICRSASYKACVGMEFDEMRMRMSASSSIARSLKMGRCRDEQLYHRPGTWTDWACPDCVAKGPEATEAVGHNGDKCRIREYAETLSTPLNHPKSVTTTVIHHASMKSRESTETVDSIADTTPRV